jgi:hypothetical protein
MSYKYLIVLIYIVEVSGTLNKQRSFNVLESGKKGSVALENKNKINTSFTLDIVVQGRSQ